MIPPRIPKLPSLVVQFVSRFSGSPDIVTWWLEADAYVLVPSLAIPISRFGQTLRFSERS